MIKRIVLILICLLSMTVNSQDFSTLWKGYFSYFDIKDITRSEDKIYAAAENAIFSYDIFSNEIETITTINGLSGETISTITYSETFDILIVGYETGLIELYFASDSEILSVVDILEKESISPLLKRINHFNEYEGLLYISTDFGISVYDLDQLQFGDTYFIGNGGAQITVNQTTVYQGALYASCGSGAGIRKGDLSNPNLIDFDQWQTIFGGNFVGIQTVGDKLYALRLSNDLFEIVNDNLSVIFTYADFPRDFRTVENQLIVTLDETVIVYDQDFNQVFSAATNDEFDTDFSSATLLENDLYIGTNDSGVYKTVPNDPLIFEVILPEGPTNNNAFKIRAGSGQLWLTYGDYTVSFNPSPPKREGVSILREEQWNNIPFDSMRTARNLNSIAINPFNPSQAFVSSFADGILEFNSEQVTELYGEENSGLESLIVPSNPGIKSIRQSASQFDQTGLLWTVTSKVDRALKSYDPTSGQWQGYSFSALITDPLFGERGFGDLAIGTGGMKWITAYNAGLIGINTDTGQINNVFSESQNMPSSQGRAVAVDSRNQVWIGTAKGLRVLFNTSGFVDDPDPRVNEIVILENGIPTELLSNQFITDIKVDGSDNKWVGTLDSGIFYFSPDGQETIYQFTTENSPLLLIQLMIFQSIQNQEQFI